MTKEQEKIVEELNKSPEKDSIKLLACVLNERLQLGKPIQISETEWVIGAKKYVEVKH